ncbi:hypothetical protein [Castellaniella sp.]|uniref:hypothetical protein n=1 Tax=Castellaniella sp. TaxID=1955812 RepID=UPI002B003D36|nr:hypothetical protein [Castellaniella sp.]
MKTYRALKAFPHGNSHVAAGAIVNLTEKQATFLNGYIEPAQALDDAPTLAEAPEAKPTTKASAKSTPPADSGNKKEDKK